MASSPIDVCNVALTEVGGARITGFPPTDVSENAYLCDLLYQQSVDEVLADHSFSCARTLKQISGSEHTLTNEWGYEYDLPVNPFCLAVLGIPDYRNSAWTVNGRTLYVNLGPPIVIEYTARITAAEMDLPHAALLNAFAMRLAFHLSTRMKQSRRGKSDILATYLQEALPAAISADIGAGQHRPQKNDSWLNAGRG